MLHITFAPVPFFESLLWPQKRQIFEKKKIFKNLLLRTVCMMKLILCIHVPGISLYKTVVFCSSQIGTLIVMATFSFYRLIMGKVKRKAISAVSLEIFEFCFCRNVYL